MTRWFALTARGIALVAAIGIAGAFAETKKKLPAASAPKPAEIVAPAAEDAKPDGLLHLSAVIGSDAEPVAAGLVWRVFAVAGDAPLRLAADVRDAEPALALPPGDYVVHVSLGLASASRRVTLDAAGGKERLSLPVGGLMVHATVNETPIPADDLRIAVYIPSNVNSEEKLLTNAMRSGELLMLPEGAYHVVSTYGASNASVRADIEVRTGKTVDVLMKHRAARITLKLVSRPGAEALPNTEWTILTPGGDIVKEDLGAFPSMILAEGDYSVIARHDGQTYLDAIKVVTGPDRDVEVLAKPPNQ
jgi:hypothetical protein